MFVCGTEIAHHSRPTPTPPGQAGCLGRPRPPLFTQCNCRICLSELPFDIGTAHTGTRGLIRPARRIDRSSNSPWSRTVWALATTTAPSTPPSLFEQGATFPSGAPALASAHGTWEPLEPSLGFPLHFLPMQRATVPMCWACLPSIAFEIAARSITPTASSFEFAPRPLPSSSSAIFPGPLPLLWPCFQPARSLE